MADDRPMPPPPPRPPPGSRPPPLPETPKDRTPRPATQEFREHLTKIREERAKHGKGEGMGHTVEAAPSAGRPKALRDLSRRFFRCGRHSIQPLQSLADLPEMAEFHEDFSKLVRALEDAEDARVSCNQEEEVKKKLEEKRQASLKAASDLERYQQRIRRCVAKIRTDKEPGSPGGPLLEEEGKEETEEKKEGELIQERNTAVVNLMEALKSEHDLVLEAAGCSTQSGDAERAATALRGKAERATKRLEEVWTALWAADEAQDRNPALGERAPEVTDKSTVREEALQQLRDFPHSISGQEVMQHTNEEFLELRSQVQQVHRSSSGVASLNSVEMAFCQLNEAMSDLLQAVCQEKEYWEQLSIEKCFPSRSMIDAGFEEHRLAAATAECLGAYRDRLGMIHKLQKQMRQAQEAPQQLQRGFEEAKQHRAQILQESKKLKKAQLMQEAKELYSDDRVGWLETAVGRLWRNSDIDVRKRKLQEKQRASWQGMQNLLQLSQLHCPEWVPKVIELCIANTTLDQGRSDYSPGYRDASFLQSVLVCRKISDYTIGEAFEQSRHKVFKAEHVRESCVLKQIDLSSAKGTKQFWKLAVTHTRYRHPFLVSLQAAFIDTDGTGKTLERVFGYLHFPLAKGTLDDVPIEELTLFRLLSLLQGSACALAYLHGEKATHGDIKPSNILCSEEFQPMLTDFELLIDATITSGQTTTVAALGGTLDFLAPELCKEGARDASKKATSKADMYSLGMTFRQALSRCRDHKGKKHGSLMDDRPRETFEKLDALADRMTQQVASARPEAKHIAEDPVFLTHIAEEREAALHRNSKPTYWSKDSSKELKVCKIEEGDQAFKALQDALVTHHILGGRDGGEKKAGRLQVRRAWRIENPLLFAKYRAEQDAVRASVDSLKRYGKSLADPRILSRLTEATGELHSARLDASINEVYLLHGVRDVGKSLLSIITSGPSKSHCTGGLFGLGVYFAEDAAKCHQYAAHTKDEYFNQVPALHRHLYENRDAHPGSGTEPVYVHYILACRVIMGYFAMTQDGKRDALMVDGGPVWLTETRTELAQVKGCPEGSSEKYHALIGESGPGHERFREFMQFKDERIYAEYLIAYSVS
ncbi:unnamed protein product [Effrenium voratum]|uniref:Protein kinase domain-containing protein n=1 Tax=Effrenium voratum TaxID=2562239 RepID=A0AA36J1C5_9DINO|nr:unnamed protein product [Effrenium voratum]CAJ1459265.1 unnamed protein product [Effrenium voratum]